jgi:hypothetical protein
VDAIEVVGLFKDTIDIDVSRKTTETIRFHFTSENRQQNREE